MGHIERAMIPPARWTSLLVLLLASAPGRWGNSVVGSRETGSGVDSARATFPELALHELAALHAGVAPVEWIQAHPTDSVALYARDLVRERNDGWCFRATSRIALADGRHVTRYAYFYPPQAPPSLVLPAGRDPRLLKEQCQLGVIWLEMPVDSGAPAMSMGTRTSEAFSSTYGAIRASPDSTWQALLADSTRRAAIARLAGFDAIRLGLEFTGTAYWRAAGRWQRDSTIVVSAYDKGSRRGATGRMLAFAYLPVSHFGRPPSTVDEEEAASRKGEELATTAAWMSGIDSARVRALIGLLVQAHNAAWARPPDSSRVRARAVDTVAVRVLGAWIAAARTLDASHRAAALLSADQIIGSAGLQYALAQDEAAATRQELGHLGAGFEHNELGGGDSYTHSWLTEAWRLDSLGRPGQLAMLAMLRMGFNNNGMCGGGDDPFRRVTVAGERLLQTLTDPATTAEVHFLVADGYADIVALAHGAGENYADSSAYIGAEEDARLNAIRHYREGLSLDSRSAEARVAWLEAWRLLAGLPPTRTHFFCVYD